MHRAIKVAGEKLGHAAMSRDAAGASTNSDTPREGEKRRKGRASGKVTV